MLPGGIDLDQLRALTPSRADHVRASLDLLERQLADGSPFVLGDEPSLADFSVYHPLWAMRGSPAGSAFFEHAPHVGAWMDRIAALGHGTPKEMSSADAVAVARAATPQAKPAEDSADPNGRHVGDRIKIFPEAYGRDPVEGELVRADAHSIAIRRRDERAGELVVHFPREGMIILSA
jgi:hypothetical protein